LLSTGADGDSLHTRDPEGPTTGAGAQAVIGITDSALERGHICPRANGGAAKQRFPGSYRDHRLSTGAGAQAVIGITDSALERGQICPRANGGKGAAKQRFPGYRDHRLPTYCICQVRSLLGVSILSKPIKGPNGCLLVADPRQSDVLKLDPYITLRPVGKDG
jgi:hypothetical protein